MELTSGFALMLLHLGCYLTHETEAVNYSVPVLPEIYETELGFGFATNWFKTDIPLSRYQQKNIEDVYNAGFRNLRVRCRAGLYTAPYNDTKFRSFLNDLEKVIDDCINGGVLPVISWEHHLAEAFATDEDMENYIIWWRKVANRLKDRDYSLTYNLFTELGIDVCQYTYCNDSLKLNPDKYNLWTSKVVKAIRATGGNNEKRILLLGSPQKLAKALDKIDKTIYENDPYMMAEWHIYASGPNKIDGSPKYWEGDGTPAQRQVLLDEIEISRQKIPLKTYFGAWMPQDNKEGALDQYEIESFARYFVSVMKQENVPTALNALDVYYDTRSATWRTDADPIICQPVNRSSLFAAIQESM